MAAFFRSGQPLFKTSSPTSSSILYHLHPLPLKPHQGFRLHCASLLPRYRSSLGKNDDMFGLIDIASGIRKEQATVTCYRIASLGLRSGSLHLLFAKLVPESNLFIRIFAAFRIALMWFTLTLQTRLAGSLPHSSSIKALLSPQVPIVSTCRPSSSPRT